MTPTDRLDKQASHIRTRTAADFFEFRFTAGLGEISLKTLLVTALWMAIAYGSWLLLREIHGDHGNWALLPVVLGFTPLALWALYDYRLGLMFAIVAAPLLTAPPIPHGFTQGFGDLFGICAVTGYLLRHPDPRKWRHLWRREYVWLLLILVAAFLSLALSPIWGVEIRYGIKYSLAEIAGYILAMAYLVVLVNELRDRLDIKVFLYAVAAAVFIVALFSVASLIWSMTCVGGFAARTALTTNGALTSTFANPNYQASYLVTVLPFALWFYLQAQPRSWTRAFAAAVALLLIFFIQATISRSGLVGLVAIWLGWLLITRWERRSRMMTVVFALMLPMTIALWWYPNYHCHPSNPSGNSSLHIKATSSQQIKNSIQKIKFAGSVSKKLGDGGVSVRVELARNAISAWRDYPITGVGPALLSNYSSVGGQVNRAHNVMLTVLAEQGIVGLLTWTGWLGSLLAVFWRVRRQVAQCGHPSAFLLLAFMGVIVQSMFMDYHRVIWVWQVGALILAWGAIAFDLDKERKELPMIQDKFRCRHPGKGRRLITRFSFVGEPAVMALNRFGVFVQKIANTLRFEYFWKRFVAADPSVVIVPSFTKSRSKHPIWDIAVAHARSLGETGTVWEFGTNNGGSLLYFWQHLPSTMKLHGLDCFEGIPEPWDSLPKGAIKGFGYPAELWRDHGDQRTTVEAEIVSTGKIPQPPQSNIRIHKGLFAHTVPTLLRDGVPNDIRLIHFDADIYMGTRPVLDSICGQIGYRFYILFDELYSVNHEFKAWMEFVELFDIEKWRVVAISEDGVQALIEVN